jgi:hypothetical protein
VEWAGPDGACCNGACCTPTKTVCCPEHYLKKTTKVCYSCDRESICLCYYHGCGHCDCDSGHCGEPYCRKFLVKKIKPCEEDAVKCVPQEVPAEPKCHHSWFSFGHRDNDSECIGGELPPPAIAYPAPAMTSTPARMPEPIAAPKPDK